MSSETEAGQNKILMDLLSNIVKASDSRPTECRECEARIDGSDLDDAIDAAEKYIKHWVPC